MSMSVTSNLVPQGETLQREVLRGGGMWSYVLRRHRILQLTDLEGGANVAALFFNRENFLERYNMSDTLKAQHIARLAHPDTLHSDMGRVMVSLVGDTLGWHDAIGGVSNAREVRERFGEGSYQEKRNDFYRNGRDNFLVEMGKWGMGKKDLVPNVNFFSKISISEDGTLRYHAEHSPAGSVVQLRAEMDVLVVLNTCHHALDTAKQYQPKPVELVVWQGEAPGPDDPCRCSRPENTRAFINTENFLR